MQTFFALLFLFSFASHAQETFFGSVSQDYYDLKSYPVDAHTKILFEKAKHKLAINNQDQTAISTLNNLAGTQTPYIPAVRLLASRALQIGDFDRGFALTHVGQTFHDLPCTYSKASLLLNAELVPCLAHADPFMLELEGQQLLHRAAHTIDFSNLEKKRHYYIPNAIQDYYQIKQEADQRLWSAFEKSLDRMPSSVRSNCAEIAREQKLFNESCYFIKKQIQDNPDAALDWAADLIGAPDFDYDRFVQNGTYEQLQALANATDHAASTRASFLLAYLDYARLSAGQSVDVPRLERNLTVGAEFDVRALLMLASYSDSKNDLIQYADRIVERLDEVDASLYGTVVPDIVQLYYAIMKSGEKKFGNGLVKLLKHTAFKAARDELVKNPDLSAQMGIQLLHMRNTLVKDAQSKNRADHRKIHDAGLALTTAASESLHENAAWALVAHSLDHAATESQKNKLNEYVAHAIITIQARLETGMPVAISCADLNSTLEKLQKSALSADSCHALAQWYLNGVPGVVERDELRAIEYLAKTPDFVVPLQTALEQGKIHDPRACLRAGMLMHQKSALVGMRNQLFSNAVAQGNLEIKKEAALYCVEHKELVAHACSALKSLFDEHALLASSDAVQAAQLREQVLTPVFNTLLSWAVGARKDSNGQAYDCHPDAIMFFYKSSFTDEFTIQDKQKIERLAEWAAYIGNKQAVDELEPKYSTLEKDTMAIIKGVDYWSAWLKLYQQDPQKKEGVDHAYSYLKILSDWALEPHEQKTLAVPAINTHYRLAQVFMDRDPIRAANHVLLIEELVKRTGEKLPQAAQHIASTGLYDILEKKAHEGVDWACYVFAHVHLNRLKIITDTHVENHQFCFERIDKIKALFEKSKTFDTNVLDARLRTQHRSQKGRPALSLAEIEYHEADMARVLNLCNKTPNVATSARGLQMLRASSDKCFPEAMFTLAGLILDGDYKQIKPGQEALEKAIHLLCAAADAGLRDAQDSLADVARQGFALRAPCGGNITEALSGQINQTLQKIGRPLPSPVSSTSYKPLSEYEQAVQDLNENKAAQALPVFQKLADAGDPRAHVYLGIMHRDGLGIDKSAQKADHYFARAIHDSATKELDHSCLQALGIALEATKDMSDKDAELDMARLRLMLHIQNRFPNPDKFNAIADRIEKAEKKLSATNQAHLLFSSGLLDELIKIAATSSSLNERVRIAKFCAHRCIHYKPSDIFQAHEDIISRTNSSSDARLIVLPVAYLRDMISEAALGVGKAQNEYMNQALAPLFADVQAAHVDDCIELFERLVAKGYIHPFQEVLGTLKLVWALYKTDGKLAQEGRRNWESAAKNGSMRAAYMIALSNLHGDQISKVIEREEAGYRVKKLYTAAPKMGELQLLELAAKNYVTTYPLLAKWYYDKEDYAKALHWYRKMRDDLPEVDMGAVGYLDTVVRAYSKLDEHDARRIAIAIAIPQQQPVSIVRNALCASYLRLVKRIEGISDEQALDFILKNAHHFFKADTRQHLEKFLKDTHFINKLSQIIQGTDAQVTLTDSCRAKAHVVKAYLMSLDYKESKNGSSHDVESAILDECDKAIKINPEFLDAYIVKAVACQSMGIKGDDKAMQEMQRSIIKSAFIMDKMQLKFKDKPLFKVLLAMIKFQGYKVAWIETLEKKYADTPAAKSPDL